MIGLDTNVLLRFLIEDDPAQHEKAKQLLYDKSRSEKIRISNIVLIEVVWVLRSVYRQAEARIIEGLDILQAIPSIEIEGITTLERVTQGKVPLSMLSDSLISESNLNAGCSLTYTFDKHAASRISGMELLQ